MFVKYKELGFEVNNENYDDNITGKTILYDPWGSPYGYSYDSGSDSFIVYSIGAELELASGEELAARYVSGEWQFAVNSDWGSALDVESSGVVSSHLK